MPQINFNPANQCTIDDPTDGAAPPSASSAVPAGSGSSVTAPEPPCQALESDSGGTGGECADALVRRFGSEGRGPTLAEPSGGPACDAETLSVLGNCGRIAYDYFAKKPVDRFDAVSCASSLISFARCEFGPAVKN